jgi:ABC-type dipeptide/oligopeptide/nickel transport system ATPase component
MHEGVVKAVDDVGFSIDEETGLVGESALASRCPSSPSFLCQLEENRRQGVMFDGVDLLRLSEKEMRGYRGRHLSMILQDPLCSLNPVFTIGDQVGEGIVIHEKVHGKPLRHRVVELLHWVGIPAPETRVGDYPHQFSGGMRQRVVGCNMPCLPPPLFDCR